MASERFENLKPKKKKIILDSIANCLSMKSTEELSVIDISKEAEISRGTFYTYFSDKDDAITTFIKDKENEFIKALKDIVLKNKGDFFSSIIETYDVIKNNYNEYHKKISKNILNVVNSSVLINYIHDTMAELDELNKWILENTDIGKKYLTTIEDVRNLMELINFTISTAILRLSMNYEITAIDYDVKLKINIIKNGMKSKLSKED